MSAKSKHTLQASSQLTEVLKIENAEAHHDDNFIIDMPDDQRNFFYPLLTNQQFNQNKQAIIQAPENEVPTAPYPHPKARKLP